jgi:lipopolysaccharide transport system ATP-binding protein
MSSDTVIHVAGLGKCYHIYPRPDDRLKQMLLPPLQRFIGRTPSQFYREFWALREISFDIQRGETVGIIGRNGSGKSTLLQLICGTLHPTTGAVHTRGRIAALLELGSGFNPEFSGRENVWLNASILGLTDEQIRDRFDAIAAFADIGEFIEQPVKTYSSGMLVRLAFAVVAHVDADILIIDEALAVGDALFTQKCMRFLRAFKQRGVLLFVSHDSNAVTGLCDRAVWLDRGACRTIGSAKEVTEAYLAALYAEQQGADRAVTAVAPPTALPERPARDMRQDLLNQSALRNDIEVFAFSADPSTTGFGLRGATLLEVALTDDAGHPYTHVIGGECVTMRVTARAHTELQQPIIGFSVKDRLGQVLFGDNTFLRHRDAAVAAKPEQLITAEFRFILPILPPGDYTVAAAIADGTQENHVQHHWIHDALVIRSLSSSASTGLLGIPMLDIQLTAT